MLLPFVLVDRRAHPTKLSRGDLLLSVLSGLCLAFHFSLWITSLSYTTVASSVVLVTTNPIFVGIASHFFLKEKVSRKMAFGIAISVAGSVIIGFGDWEKGPESLIGDILALLGAVAMSCYLLIGRKLRQKIGLYSYIFKAYTSAALFLIVICLIFGQEFVGYSPKTYFYLFLLALVPQIIGHSSINWALGSISPSYVSIALLAEPVIAAVLAYFILYETPTPLRIAGSIIVLWGIYRSVSGEGIAGISESPRGRK